MNISNVEWSSDLRGRPVLELKLDGHAAYILSSQRTELTQRGILDGIVFLNSERSAQVPNIYVKGDFTPPFSGLDLVGCTDGSPWTLLSTSGDPDREIDRSARTHRMASMLVSNARN